MIFLKQSTAVDVMLGPFVDDTDGKTTEEALTLAQADLQLTKNGGAAAQKNDATSATHRYGGNYMVDLNATDTATLGHLRLMCKEAGALPVISDFMVLPANIYDSLVGGTDTLQADVSQWLGTAVATPTTAGVPEVDVTHLGGATQSATDLKDFADAGYNPTTNYITGIEGTANTLDDLNDIAATDIVSAGAITTLAGAVANVDLVDVCTTNTDMRGTDNALLAVSVPANFADLAITVTTGQVTVGTNNDKSGYTISGAKTTLDDLNDIAATDIVSAGAITTLTGAVVNVDLVDTCTVNTDMRGTDNAATNVQLAATQVDVSAILNDTDISIPAAIAGVQSDTDNIQSTLGTPAGISISADIADKTGYSISGTKTTLDALNDISAGQVNAEVVDVLNVDTYAEPGQGKPGATISLAEKINYLYKGWRNKLTQNGSSFSLYNDGGTVIDQKASASDDSTTATKDEFISGP